MVRVKEFSKEEAATSDDESTVEEDDNETPRDPPGPPNPPPAPIISSVPGPPVPEEEAAGPSAKPRASGVISPILRVGLSKQYACHLLQHCGNSIELNRSLQEAHGAHIAEDLSKWAAELQPLAGPNGNGYPQFACSISAPDTPAPDGAMDMDDNRSTEPDNDRQAEQGTAGAFVTESSTQTTVYIGVDTGDDKEEGNKTESDESTKEKSNGIGEKVQLAAAASAKARLLSSPELSDYELSDVSDSLAPLDHEYTTPSALNDWPWSEEVGQASGLDNVSPELTVTAEGKEPSEASDEGEAAALPANSIVIRNQKGSENWNDDRLFKTRPESSETEPSTSSGVSARPPSPTSPPSPASPTTERRRCKINTRQRLHQHLLKDDSRRIFIPTEKIGRIVGKGGRKIKEIEKESGAKISIEHKKSAKPVTQITLTGTEKQIAKADEQICFIIRNCKRPKSGEPTTTSESSVEEQELKRLLLGIKNQVLDGEKRCRKPAD